jgi:hypothetical protein
MAFDREPMYLLSTAGVLLTHAEGFARDADGTLEFIPIKPSVPTG